MENTIIQLAQQLQHFLTQKEEYQQKKIEQELIDDLSTNEEDLIKQGEELIDKKIEERKYIDTLFNSINEIETIFNELHRELLNSRKEIEKEDKKNVEQINKIIDSIKSIRQRKVDKEIELYPKKKKGIQGECDDLNDELEERRILFDQTKYHIDEEREIESCLKDLCQLNVKSKLFDSNIHKWSIHNSDFTSKVKGHHHICIVIEDKNENVFGGYCSKEIGITKFHFDPKGFLFSVKRNGMFKMKKYHLKENCYDLKISLDEFNGLFSFGAMDKNNNNVSKDICVFKKDICTMSYCEPYSYEYNGEENVFIDNQIFRPERIVVYEMEETLEMKMIRVKQKQEERKSDLKRWVNEKQTIEQMISEMTSRKMKEIIFDTEIHNWNINNSQFGKNLKGKQNIVVLIEDERTNLFGYFIGDRINLNENFWCNKSFMFCLRKDGEFNLKQYYPKGKYYYYRINIENDANLMEIGRFVNNEHHKDIKLFKKERGYGFCKQLAYDYKGENCALCGKYAFNIKRIVVYQLF